MREHGRFDYSAIVDRKPWKLESGARVAVWVIPNIEHFLFDRPSTSIAAVTRGFTPDIHNYSWRDYGVRVGVWRMMDVMERYGIKGTAALNSDVIDHYPRIIEAGKELSWEWMGHGETNSAFLANMEEGEERALIKRVVDKMTTAFGDKPRGWLGPALTETYNTPDILAEAGFDYIADWVNDEQPYRMKVRSGTMHTIPYSAEINDIPAFIEHHQSPEQFGRMIIDQFDGLYESGEETARVMSICLHPFLIGHPFRAKYLDEAFAHISSRSDVWFATGGEIIDAWKAANA